MVDLSGINGWFDFSLYYDEIINRIPDNSRVLEIGVYQGKSTIYFADLIRNSKKNIEFHCCDIFDKVLYYKTDYYNIFIKNLNKFNLSDYVIIHKNNSVDVLNSFSDQYFDFIYIDGDHSCEAVYNDVFLSLKKIKKSGILAGHDETMHSVRCGLIKSGIKWRIIVPNTWEYKKDKNKKIML